MLKVKSTVSEINISSDGFNRKASGNLMTAKNKKGKEWGETTWDLQDKIKQPNIHVIGVPEGEDRWGTMEQKQ